jgi:hypothetical protein
MEILRNEELNFTENDIQFENDLEVLQEWLLGTEQQIQIAKNTILNAKLAHQRGEEVNSEWFGKLKGYRGVIVVLKMKIIDRIRILKKEHKENVKLTNDEILIAEFKKQLSKAEFKRISDIAKVNFIE